VRTSRYVGQVFDLSMGEILLIAIVLLVVVGPRELPTILRSLGRGVAKLRNMSWELREQSGIDEVIKEEGLQRDLDAIRSLSRGKIVDTIVNQAGGAKTGAPRKLQPNGPAASTGAGQATSRAGEPSTAPEGGASQPSAPQNVSSDAAPPAPEPPAVDVGAVPSAEASAATSAKNEPDVGAPPAQEDREP
jgi:sec-independent protein translocase protein TatB